MPYTRGTDSCWKIPILPSVAGRRISFLSDLSLSHYKMGTTKPLPSSWLRKTRSRFCRAAREMSRTAGRQLI